MGFLKLTSLLLGAGFLMASCSLSPEGSSFSSPSSETPESSSSPSSSESESQNSDPIPSISEESESLSSLPDSTDSASSPEIPEDSPMANITFASRPFLEDPQSFSDSVKIDGAWNNDKADYGIIRSPDYSLKGNGEAYEVYAANVTVGLHSFAYVAMPTNGKVELTLSFSSVIASYEVFSSTPGQIETSHSLLSKKIEIAVSAPGNYTILPDGKTDKAFTLFVEEVAPLATSKTIRTVYPGIHDSTLVANEGEALVFKTGFHRVKNVSLSSHSEVYFEPGAYLEAIDPDSRFETPVQNPDWAGCTTFVPFFFGQDLQDVKIHGQGILDLSKISWHARNGIKLERCSGVKLADFMINNAPEWTFFLACCTNLTIRNCKIFGYRQNSDGYAIVDCQSVRVSDSFARSGDDLFEVKSMYGAETIEIKDIAFERIVGWPDKCRGFGVISEVSRPIKDVSFRQGVIIEYPSSWMDKLGALCVISDGKADISSISFEDIDIHHASFYAINVTVDVGSSSRIEGVSFRNITCSEKQKVRLCNTSEKGGGIANLTFDSVILGGTHFLAESPLMSATGEIGVCTFA